MTGSLRASENKLLQIKEQTSVQVLAQGLRLGETFASGTWRQREAYQAVLHKVESAKQWSRNCNALQALGNILLKFMSHASCLDSHKYTIILCADNFMQERQVT